MIVTLDSKRCLTVAASLVRASPGDCFDAPFDANVDIIIFRRIKRKANWLAVWKRCPVPLHDLPFRSRELPENVKFGPEMNPTAPGMRAYRKDKF